MEVDDGEGHEGMVTRVIKKRVRSRSILDYKQQFSDYNVSQGSSSRGIHSTLHTSTLSLMQTELEPPSFEVQQGLRALEDTLKDPAKLQLLLKLEGDEAQRTLDVLQYVSVLFCFSYIQV